MLTIDAILSKRFSKAMGGYRQDEVDSFIQQLAAEVERLQNENEDLEHKLEILAEKIEKYRKGESSIQSAWMGAQRLGEGLLLDAKKQVEQIRRDGLRDLEATKRRLEIEIQQQQYELSQLKKETSSFKGKLLGLYAQQIDLIQNIPVPAELFAANENQEQSEQESELHEVDEETATEPVFEPAVQDLLEGVSEQEELDEAEAEEEQFETEAETQPQKEYVQQEYAHNEYIQESDDDEIVEEAFTEGEPELLDEDDIYDDEIVIDKGAFEAQDKNEEHPVYSERGYSIRSAQEESRFGPLKFGEGFEIANLPNDNSNNRKKFSFKGKFGN
ncbi:MAG: DivIVA domain-containing protein [Oscillospiraceae bacterium]|nr:DivIVA domain-containing protein [Oscillospiraceae bacterium]